MNQFTPSEKGDIELENRCERSFKKSLVYKKKFSKKYTYILTLTADFFICITQAMQK